MMASKMLRRNIIVFWRAWRSSFFLSILGPLMFLSAMGFGLGSLVNEGESFQGVDYFDFFATGVLASSALQAGVFLATYPIMAKMVWQRNYEAVLATPLGVRDIVLGELMWIAWELTQIASPFFLVMALFGIFDSALALAAVPIVVLLGSAVASLTMAFTATQQNDEAYTWLFRFVVTPLFLLSGTFFPIAELPVWGQVLAHATPLYHAVELVRQIALFSLETSAVWHLGYLLVMLLAGVQLSFRTFERRLRP